MTLTMELNARQAMGDAFDVLVNTGGGTAAFILEDSGDTEVASFALGDPAFGATDASGNLTLNGTTLTDSDADGGLVEHFAIYNKAGTKCVEGVCAVSGEDLDVSSLNIGAGDQVDLTSFVMNFPA